MKKDNNKPDIAIKIFLPIEDVNIWNIDINLPSNKLNVITRLDKGKDKKYGQKLQNCRGASRHR